MSRLPSRTIRRGVLAIAFLALALPAVGCKGWGGYTNSPTKAQIDPNLIADPTQFEEMQSNARLLGLENEMCKTFKTHDNKPRKNVLAISGGYADGAYAAGIVYGWTQTGERPVFDVVNGTSAGAFVAYLAFLGPEYDEDLKTIFTTTRTKDVYTDNPIASLAFKESLKDTKPLAALIAKYTSAERLALVAHHHHCGRRLYIVTHNLDGCRPTVWDMGAIAEKGTCEALELFRKVLLATASAPPLFAPVEIPVRVDGKCYTELHNDGGATANLVAETPYLPMSEIAHLDPIPRRHYAENFIQGMNLYVIRCGKLYMDPRPVARNILGIGLTTLNAQGWNATGDEFLKLYWQSRILKFNYYQTAVPEENPGIKDFTKFIPEEMCALFESARCLALEKKAWRTMPPEILPGEYVPRRGGVDLCTYRPEHLPGWDVLDCIPGSNNVLPSKSIPPGVGPRAKPAGGSYLQNFK